MFRHSALVVVALLLAPGPAGTPVAAVQRQQPAQVVIDWLTAKSVADAVKHLPPAAVDQVRAFTNVATEEQLIVVKMLEMVMAPVPLLRELGNAVKVSGTRASPVITLAEINGPAPSGSESMELTVLAAVIDGDTATVPLRVRAPIGAPEAAGAVELKRDGGTWRIVSADLGPGKRYPRFDQPDYLRAAAGYIVEELETARAEGSIAAATGNLRALISAQLTFSIDNGGFYAPPECLMNPVTCNPQWQSDSPAYLLAGMLTPPNYAGTFYPGAKPSSAQIRNAKAIPKSLTHWAYVFAPADPASALKLKVLCADSTSRLCVLPNASVKPVGGVCPATCEDMK